MKNLSNVIFKSVFIVSLLLVNSCEKDYAIVVEETIAETSSQFSIPSIADAKKHLERTNDYRNPFDKSDILSKNGESNFYIDWDASEVKRFKEQDSLDILYTPVNHNIEGKRVKSLVASVLKEGELESYIYTLLYEKTSTNEAFSGAIARFDILGNLAAIYIYRGGSLTKYYKFNVNESTSRNVNCTDYTIEEIIGHALDTLDMMEEGEGAVTLLDCVEGTGQDLSGPGGGGTWNNPEFNLYGTGIPINTGGGGGSTNNSTVTNNNNGLENMGDDLTWWQQQMADVLKELYKIPLTQEQTQYVNNPANVYNISAILDFLNLSSNNGGASTGGAGIVGDFLDIAAELPAAKFERYLELQEILKENPWALIEDCAEQNGMDTSNYIDLYNLPFPQECSDRLFNMGNAWHHQPFSDGNVPLANIDYYGVEITDYPDFNNDGNPDSTAQIYQAFREKFTDLASGEKDNFQFSCNVPGNPTNTGDISWEFIPLTSQDGLDFISNNPITSILLIEADASGLFPTIAADDGAIMVTDFTNNYWTISTIMTPNNGTQPFSGNRQWGWLINENGNFEFFTRAVDVAKISKLLNILSFGGANTECQQDTYYNIAEESWKNMQQEIAEWVNDNGGQANVIPSTAVRVDKSKIEELLTSNNTIDEINCN